MTNIFTIIYYTSNREKPEFEEKIKANLLKVKGDIPIISVSHKPIDFGVNVCVGMQIACNHNVYRQMQIGAKIADTPFVVMAESDCLYPPDYFDYKPDLEHECYKYSNCFIFNEWGKGKYRGFYRKEIGTFAQIVGRKHLIDEVDRVLKNRPYWGRKRKKGEYPIELFRRRRWSLYQKESPVISLKTHQGMRKHTKIIEPPVFKLPYWGEADVLRKEIWG